MPRERMYMPPAQQNPPRRRYIKAVPPSGTDIAMNSCAAHLPCPAAQSVPFTLLGDKTTSFENVLVEKFCSKRAFSNLSGLSAEVFVQAPKIKLQRAVVEIGAPEPTEVVAR